MIEPTERELRAIDWLAAHFAALADVWEGNWPGFSEPPNWRELWEQALEATATEPTDEDEEEQIKRENDLAAALRVAVAEALAEYTPDEIRAEVEFELGGKAQHAAFANG